MSDLAEPGGPPPDLGGEDGEAVEEVIAHVLDRDRDLLGRSNSPVRKKLAEIRKAVREGFEYQRDRSDDIDDYWKIYDCVLSDMQTYNGNGSIFVPIVHDAVDALVTRIIGQLFPQFGHYVAAIAADGSTEKDLVAILDHYILETKFRSLIAEPLCRNGYIEGHLNLYVDWNEVRRVVVSRETHGPIDPLNGQEMPGPEMMDVTEEEIVEAMPGFQVVHDSDVWVWPSTADTLEDAFAMGGGVAIVRYWTKAKIEAMIEEGAIREEEGEALIDNMRKVEDSGRDISKTLREDVGIRAKGTISTVWEVWTYLKLGSDGRYSSKGRNRLCRLFLGPDDIDLGAKRNPYWNDRCPLLSIPLKKVAGVFKGASPVSYIDTIQYEANDAANEMADADHYGALPIVARDPEAGDGPMILNLAAIWDIDPNKVKFMEFPDLGPRGIRRIQMATQAIFQSLNVNPGMIPQQTGRPGAKRNQAEIALEQQVDILTSGQAANIQVEGIYIPVCGWMVDLDYQFRTDRDLQVRMWGEMGRKSMMQKVAPLQNRHGFTFIWRGAEQMKQSAAIQQMFTAGLNVFRGLAPQLKEEGVQLKFAPLVEQWIVNMIGPTLASLAIVDQTQSLTLDTELEVQMMLDGFQTDPHPLDNDQEKVQAFHQALTQTGDPHGTIRVRLQKQMTQMQQKAAARQMMQMQQQLQAGPQPGGGPGMPQPGAAPAGPRQLKPPPGAIHRDQMPAAGGVVPMPHLGGRRM